MGVKQVACGIEYSIFLMEDGTVKGTGRNDFGQLGIGNTIDQFTIQTIPITGVKQVACGSYYSIFLMEDGTVKGVGSNNSGQLGIGNTIDQSIPQSIPYLTLGVRQISCGTSHTMFLMEDGTVKGTGNNNNRQLGIGTSTVNRTSPYTVPVTGVRQISCGGNHNMLLMEDGTVKGAGNNGYGQLGLGEITNPYGTFQTIPITGVKEISCGSLLTMFLMEDGAVKGVGYNSQGQLGIGNTTTQITVQTIPITRVKRINNYNYHTMFLMEDGTVKGVGYNTKGQLGIDSIPIQTSIISINTINNVQQISCGDYHTIFLMEDGTVKGSGSNTKGQLALTTQNDINFITDIFFHKIEIIVNNTKLTLVKDNINIYYKISDIGSNINFSVFINDIIIFNTIINDNVNDTFIVANNFLNSGINEITFKLISNIDIPIRESFLIFKDEDKLTLIDGYISTKEVTNTKNYTNFIVETSHTGRLLLASWNKSKWELLERQKYNPVNSETNATKLLFLVDKETKLKGYGIGWK